MFMLHALAVFIGTRLLMPMSSFLRDAVFNKSFNNTDYTGVATMYVKLHLGDPGTAGTNNAAGETDRTSFTVAAASSGAGSNEAAITWTNVSNTETYSYVSIWDAAAAGNCLMTGALTASKAVVAGDTFEIAIGDLDLTFA